MVLSFTCIILLLGGFPLFMIDGLLSDGSSPWGRQFKCTSASGSECGGIDNDSMKLAL